ncbi:aminoacyl-tRNA hydrolase [Helicobacter jaachi]|uniref:Peptidyl-tRNA hydrolase n=1 Tax=Helicobacter jaachi TaxID=1677920 RepID=A0A4U8TCD5_9HELI|nr:aminoacyl-tRNA hydrolase [Helicobacter jaachi]TLD97626.1 aminoacyl-tRNA hydrolase [Helicobacter jaachi]
MSCFLVAGLGNPGVKYQNTRHNAGFLVLDFLAQALQFSFTFNKQFNAQIASITLDSHKIFFLKPHTFMNCSGECIAPFARYFDILEMLVVHDELDISFGSMRFKCGGSSGGHNGLKSIDKVMGNEYLRLRFGIGRSATQEVVEYVLSDFSPKEQEELDVLFAHAKEAIMSFCYMACSGESSAQILSRLQNNFTLKAR